MRLYDVTDGSITIDGIDIRDYDQHSLRSQIGVVLQENFLFKGTIYSNIAYAKPGRTHEEVIRAARMANAHSFIMRQPDGYNTIVGDSRNDPVGRRKTANRDGRERCFATRRYSFLTKRRHHWIPKRKSRFMDAINALIDGRTTIAIAPPPFHPEKRHKARGA